MFTTLIPPGHELYETVTGRIQQIAEAIRKNDLQNERIDAYGGKPGVALVFAWMAYLFPEENYSDHAFGLLNEVIDDMGALEWSYDMGRELSGAAFALQLLQNKGVIDEEDDLGLDAVDDFLYKAIPVCAEALGWDPLLGIVPIGTYFLERFKKTGDVRPLELIAEQLLGFVKKHEGCDVWITPGHHYQPEDCLNFGMAHGMPGVICMLSKLYAAGIQRERMEPRVNSCIQFLLSKQNDEKEVSQFPAYLLVRPKGDESKYARLGWCYGDLGMAFALLQWGYITEQQALVEKGTGIALHAAARSVEETYCRDAPMCHGSSGLMHQYNRLYQFTGKEAFKNAALEWTKHTLEEFYLPGEGLSGYPFLMYDDAEKTSKLVGKPTLLEGEGGVLLAFSAMVTAAAPEWDALFLTNLEEKP